jgi:outer membrane protein assembly factor BamB
MRHPLPQLCTLAATLFCAAAAGAFDGWHQIESTTLDGSGSAWDYVNFDAASNRLYIGHRKEGLQVFDVATRKLLKTIAGTPTASSNGATLMPEFDLGISNNENGSVTPFRLSTLEAADAIKLGDELDTSHYDPATQRIVVNMAAGKDGTDLVVLQAPSLKQVGVIHVATQKPEHAESDGNGNFYLAARDTEKVYRIDTRELKVTAEWPTPGCGQTNSTALDRANRRLFLGCRGNAGTKPSFAVLNLDSGKVIYSAEVGGGNDGVVYDAELKRIFLANGVNAVLHVFEQVDADTYKPVEALGTQAGVRSLAFNPKTHVLYAVTSEGAADFGKKITTSVSPYYANTFFPNSFRVLTYGRR